MTSIAETISGGRSARSPEAGGALVEAHHPPNLLVGNIYGSANAVTKWNIGIRKELREKIAVSLDYRF